MRQILLVIALCFLVVIASSCCVDDSTTIVVSTDSNTTNCYVSSEYDATQFTPTSYEFEPGAVLIGFKDPCDESSIKELFPELYISEVEDVNKKLFNQIKDLPGMEKQIEECERKIGLDFVIKLSKKDKNAVLEAITIIIANPRISYAIPNYYCVPN